MILSFDSYDAAPDPDVTSEWCFSSFTAGLFGTLYFVVLICDWNDAVWNETKRDSVERRIRK